MLGVDAPQRPREGISGYNENKIRLRQKETKGRVRGVLHLFSGHVISNEVLESVPLIGEGILGRCHGVDAFENLKIGKFERQYSSAVQNLHNFSPDGKNQSWIAIVDEFTIREDCRAFNFRVLR